MSFLAKYSLVIGTPDEDVKTTASSVGSGYKGILIDDLHIEFKVVKTGDTKKKNYAEFKVFNLAPETIKKITRESVVIFKVGYGDSPLETCFTGDVFDFGVVEKETESITTINCQVGYTPSRGARLSKTYPKGWTVEKVIRDIVGFMGYPAPRFASNNQSGINLSKFGKDATLLSDRTVNDYPERVLRSLCEEYMLISSLEDGNVYWIRLTGQAMTDEEIYVEYISPETGMIGSPEPMIKNSHKKKKEPDVKFGYKLETTMNPRLVPGEKALIKSASVNNQLLTIWEVTHEGSYEGSQWKSKVEVVDPSLKESEIASQSTIDGDEEDDE